MPRKVVHVSSRTVFIVSCSLVFVLISTSLLLYFNSSSTLGVSFGAVILEPTAVTPHSDAQGQPAGLQAVDENFRRAVSSQLAQIEMATGKIVPTPIPAVEKPPLSPSKVSVQPVTLVVNTVGAPLNVRAQPGISAPVIGSLAPNTTLTAIGLHADGEWILAHVPELGEPGWVFAGLVRVTSGNLAVLRLVDTELQEE